MSNKQQLITLIQFTEEEIKQIEETAKKRYESNRKANHPTTNMHPTRSRIYHSDIVGAAGELAVAKFLALPWTGQFFEQEEFSQIKYKIFDVGDYEVRTTDHPKGRLVLQAKDSVYKPNTPYIFVRLHDQCTAEVVGWYTPKEGVIEEHYWQGKYNNPAYYVPTEKLHSLETLPRKKAS